MVLPLSPFRSLASFLLVAVACLTVGRAAAQDLVVLDFPPSGETKTLPIGLSAPAAETFDGLARIEIPLLPLNDEGALLVSVMFRDDDGALVLAKWVNAQGETVLMPNLSEGVNGWNQRTIKVPFDLLKDAGKLVFETDATVMPVKRVTLSWTWPTHVFMGVAAQPVEVVQSAGRVFTRQDLAEAVKGRIPDSWSEGVWKAYLQEEKEALDEPLEFAVPIATLPRIAVLRAKVLGFPLENTAEIWVNGHKLPPVSLSVPELSTAGFFETPAGGMRYAGWRDASVVVPISYLQKGDNSFVFAAQPGAYLKNAYLELNFDDEGSPFETTVRPSALTGPTETQATADLPAEPSLVP